MIITLTVATLCGLIFVVLTLRVSQGRIRSKISLGDGGDAGLLARVRAHANFAEFVPLCLILMGLIETNVGRSKWLGGLGVVLIVARVLHPIGMGMPVPNIPRAGGALLTMIVLAALSIWALIISARLHGL